MKKLLKNKKNINLENEATKLASKGEDFFNNQEYSKAIKQMNKETVHELLIKVNANSSIICEVQLGIFQVTINPSLFNQQNKDRYSGKSELFDECLLRIFIIT